MTPALATSDYYAPSKAMETDDAFDILEFASSRLTCGVGAALCTLVEIRGGSSKSLGAHMAVSADGLYCGYVSGGCTEAAIACEAIEAIKNGTDRFVMLGDGSPFFDIVLPCGGGIPVAVHILHDPVPVDNVLQNLRMRKPAALSYDAGKKLLSLGHGAAGWNNGTFTTIYKPRARLLLSGRSLEVEATARIGKAVGYEVVRLDPGALWDDTLIDPHTAVAALSHDLDMEVSILRRALDRHPFYIGALGSSRTHQKRIRRLISLGFSDAEIERIKAPIGMISKARDAQTLGLSVIAEVAAVWQSMGNDLASTDGGDT